MPTTATLLLPYPAPSDPADVPLDVQRLADRIEAVRGAANGLASLDATGKVPAAQLSVPKTTISPISGGPPASPANGDIWIATGVDANNTRWQFQYNAGSASTYKWEFIGGAPVVVAGGSATPPVTVWTNISSSTLTISRAGEYLVDAGGQLTSGSSGPGTYMAAVYLNTVANNVGLTFQMSLSASFYGIWTIPPQPVALAAASALGLNAYANLAGSTYNGHSLRVTPRRII